ncbi:MAG: PAS domain-containing protein, partial [Bacteroidota bacterium]|nr:PAS domain-containing protein [Bacteroidota bacterium]
MQHKHVLIHNKVEIVEDREDAVWAMDENYRLTAFNLSFKKRMEQDGWTMVERGMDLKEVYKAGKFFGPCDKGCQQALQLFPTTSRLTHDENGRLHVHEFTFQPFMDTEGDVKGCCIWQKDITREEENKERLLESQLRYREAQEITDFGHWNWDLREDKIQWSNQLFRMFEREPGEFNTTFDATVKIVHPEDRQVLIDDVDRCIKENKIHDMVFRVLLDNGTIRYMHQKGRPYYDENGMPYRMSGTTQDVTKDVLANQQIVEQNHELQNFVRIISHNLRGPISNLLMLSKIYEWGKDEMNDDILKKIELTTEALDQTIKDLHLSLSLKSADKEMFREVLLKDVMKDVDGLLSEEIIKNRATVNTDFSGAEAIFGTKSYVVNIFYNLILNAINYSKE